MTKDMRHLFFCPGSVSSGGQWTCARRDRAGQWLAPEPRGGLREVVEHDLPLALSQGLDFTVYGQYVAVFKGLNVDEVPQGQTAMVFLPEGSPDLAARWAKLEIGTTSALLCYEEGYGRRPDREITAAVGETPFQRGVLRPGVMVRNSFTLKDFLPDVWAALQVKYGSKPPSRPGWTPEMLRQKLAKKRDVATLQR